jgi:hypothetical protein
MARTVRVRNLKELQNAFIAAGKDAPRFAARALREEADEAFALSQAVVPIKTGALRTSGEVLGPQVRGTRAFVEINYGGPAAPYAIYVHELPPSRARHDYPTRWKYLENPVRLYAREMGPRMTQRVLDMIARKFEIGS